MLARTDLVFVTRSGFQIKSMMFVALFPNNCFRGFHTSFHLQMRSFIDHSKMSESGEGVRISPEKSNWPQNAALRFDS